MTISYHINHPISAEQFQNLLTRSTLGERRPTDDLPRLRGMIENSNLTVTAWDKERLVGIARAMTDFHFACYLSDLAVCQNYQKQGIGVALQQQLQQALKPGCKLILLAAPAAKDYYQHIGFSHDDRCWVIEQDKAIGTNG